MTVYVETDFLLAPAKDSDWLQGSTEDALVEYDVETSPFSYLELLLAGDRYEFDYVPLVANLLEIVPVRNEEEKQVVLKAVNVHQYMTHRLFNQHNCLCSEGMSIRYE